ncbi:hypothetical protein KCU67_g14032, partial [Aureobasidium melanogenum]
DDRKIGSVNRNFGGFAREIFTDTGVYALRMDSAALEEGAQEQMAMTLDQRAVMLATAVSIDFDYFSRHSGHVGGGGFFPLWFPGMGGAAEGGAVGGAAGGAAGEVGAAEGAAGAMGGAARGAGTEAMGAGAVGAGTIAGAEAMNRGWGTQQPDDASPQAPVDPYQNDGNIGQSQGDTWGEQSPWAQQPQQQDDPWGNQGGSDGGDGGDGFDFDDFF